MPTHDDTVYIAKAILIFRRIRSDFLPRDLFAEPAWEILLELFLADAKGEQLSIKELSQRSDVPLNILSRWQMHLIKLGLIVGDAGGNTDDTLMLTAEGIGKLERLLSQARPISERWIDAEL